MTCDATLSIGLALAAAGIVLALVFMGLTAFAAAGRAIAGRTEGARFGRPRAAATLGRACPMTPGAFATALRACGFRLKGNRIIDVSGETGGCGRGQWQAPQVARVLARL